MPIKAKEMENMRRQRNLKKEVGAVQVRAQISYMDKYTVVPFIYWSGVGRRGIKWD